jgi:ComF family protein
VRRPLRSVLESLAAVLLPSDCRICSRPLVRLSRIPVCETCLASLRPAEVDACSICGEVLEFSAAEPAPVCGLCRRVPPNFDFAISFAAYEGALRRLVHLLKYEQLRPAAEVIGNLLSMAVLARQFADGRVLVAPVPLHGSKKRQRGFNQSELIARSALRHLHSSGFELQSRILRRVRPTVSQTGLTRHQRRENVRGAFVVAAPELVKGRAVMIVDDVYTTGTTLNECARILRNAGARQVVVATAARVYRQSIALQTQQGAPQASGWQRDSQLRNAAVVQAVAG